MYILIGKGPCRLKCKIVTGVEKSLDRVLLGRMCEVGSAKGQLVSNYQ